MSEDDGRNESGVNHSYDRKSWQHVSHDESSDNYNGRHHKDDCVTIGTPLCANAFECCAGWKLDKGIKISNDETSKDVSITLFKGDSTKVIYDLEVKRSKKQQICFTWPLTIVNQSKHQKITNLKVIVKAFICSSNQCNNSTSPCNGCYFVGEFSQGTCDIEEERSKQVIISGCFSDNAHESSRYRKLKLVSIIDHDSGKIPSYYIIVPIKKESCDIGKLLLKDEILDFSEKICRASRIPIAVLYDTGIKGNVHCGETICNVAKIVECNDDWSEFSSNKPVSEINLNQTETPLATSEAKITINCVNIKLDCHLSNNSCSSNWCVSKCSELVKDNEIMYTIRAEKLKLSSAQAEFSAKICLDGCGNDRDHIPPYSKEFCLSVYKQYSPTKPIFTEKFRLGGNEGICHKIKPRNCQLSTKDDGEFLFVLSYERQVYDLENDSTMICNDSKVEEKKIVSCSEGWKNTSAILRDDLDADGRYKVSHLGSFETESELKDFLCGKEIQINQTTDFYYTLKFFNVTCVRNTVYLTANNKNNHSVIASSQVEDILHREESPHCSCDDDDRSCHLHDRNIKHKSHNNEDSNDYNRKHENSDSNNRKIRDIDKKVSSDRHLEKSSDYEKRKEHVIIPQLRYSNEVNNVSRGKSSEIKSEVRVPKLTQFRY